MHLPDFHIDIYVYRDEKGMHYQCFLKNKLLFSGSDLRHAVFHAPIGVPSVVDVLHTITVRPGERDKKFFDNYTAQQRAWCRSAGCKAIREHLFNYSLTRNTKDQDKAREYFRQHLIMYRHPNTIFSLNDLTDRFEGIIYLTQQQRINLKSILLKKKLTDDPTPKILEAIADDFRKLKKDPLLDTILFDEDKVTFKVNRNSKKELTAIVKHIISNYESKKITNK